MGSYASEHEASTRRPRAYLVDVGGLDTKVADVKRAIGAERKALDGLAGAGVDEIVLGEESLEAAEQCLELGRTVCRGMRRGLSMKERG